jgi:hypothetical protein
MHANLLTGEDEVSLGILWQGRGTRYHLREMLAGEQRIVPALGESDTVHLVDETYKCT